MPDLVIIDPPQRNQSAEKFWAFICIDKDGCESICGMNTGMGWMMMATTNYAMVSLLRDKARVLAANSPEGTKIILREYHNYTDLEELN